MVFIVWNCLFTQQEAARVRHGGQRLICHLCIDIGTAKEHDSRRHYALPAQKARLTHALHWELAGLSMGQLIQTLVFAHTAPLGDV